MEQMGNELRQAIGSLDTWAWDGRSRSRAEPMLNRVQPESRRVTEELDNLGRTLMRIADTFELEDNNAARELEGMAWVDFDTTISGVPISLRSPQSSGTVDLSGSNKKEEKTILERFEATGGVLSIGMDAVAALPALSVLSVKYMSGFSGNLWKDAFSLGGKSFARTWRDMAQTPLDDLDLGAAGLVLGSVCEVIGESGENWREYGGDPGKMAGGLFFDSALGIGASLAGGAAGTAIGAGIGGGLGSVVPVVGTSAGAVIGGKIGGIIGGWYAGQWAEDLENIKIGGQELDQTVANAVDRGLDSVIDGVTSLF
jgi:uncharacterized protein YukE